MKKPVVIDREWIISHLPKDIPTEVVDDSIRFGELYVDENLIVWSEGERGGPDDILYQATDEVDLRFWTFGEVCSSIASEMELRNRKQEEMSWRYVRDHVEGEHWVYRENKNFRYNAIHDFRKSWFEKELQLLKPVVPNEQWERKSKEREKLMNYWFKSPHWILNRDKVCFEEVSDSKEIHDFRNPMEEPRPGSIIN